MICLTCCAGSANRAIVQRIVPGQTRRKAAASRSSRQRAMDSMSIARNGFQVGARCLVGLGVALFPVAQRAERYLKPRRELFLREAERPPDDFQTWSLLHAIHVRVCKRLRVGVEERGCVPLFLGHRIEAAPIMLCCPHDISVLHEVLHEAPR